MRGKFCKFNYFKKEKGSVMVIALLILIVMLILGMALLNVVASNFKLTGAERDFQAVYYIAEAGINRIIHDIGKKVDELSEEILSHEEFFEQLDEYIDEYILDKNAGEKPNSFILEGFEKIFNEDPLAEIVIDTEDLIINDENTSYNEGVKGYIITSEGKIGRLSRTVNTSIEITHRIGKSMALGHHPAFDYVMYSGGEDVLKIPSGSDIDGSVYGYNINFNAYRTTINGSIVSETSVQLSGGMEANGNIYAMDGTVGILSSETKVIGDIHATDNVILNSGTTLIGSIYTEGDTELKSSNAKVTGDIHAGGNVSLGSASKVKDIYTSGNVKFVSSGATVDGEIHAVGYVGESNSGNGVTVNGNIFSDNNVIARPNQNYKIYGDVHAMGNIENGAGNHIAGDAISAKNVINKGTIKGIIIQNGDPITPEPPTSPKSPDFEAYRSIEAPKLSEELLNYQPSKDKEIISTNTLRISPGNYGIIEFDTNSGGTLILESGGNYFFNAITGQNQNKTLRLDFSKGENINIYVKNNLKWNGTIEVSVDGMNWTNLRNLSEKEQKNLAKRIYWETHGEFEIHEGGDKHWLGTLLAKENIKLVGSSYIVGALATHERFSEGSNYGITFIYSSGGTWEEDDDNNEGTGDGDNKGQNVILPENRIKTINPIREK